MSSPEDIRVRAESVRSRALSLGFDACGITSAAPPESGPEFLRALGEGRHAGMEWLARNAERRLNPGQVLPGARSVVLVASSYAGAEDFGIQASMTPQNRGCHSHRVRRHRPLRAVSGLSRPAGPRTACVVGLSRRIGRAGESAPRVFGYGTDSGARSWTAGRVGICGQAHRTDFPRTGELVP